MSDEIGRDPNFRAQYECGVPQDPQVDDALGGQFAPRLRLPPATQPLRPMPMPAFVRLR